MILCALLISPPERTVWALPRNVRLVGQGCHCIDRHQRLAKRNVLAESVDSLFCLFCLFDVTILVGSKCGEEHAPASDAMAIEWRCRLLGQGRIVVSADVVIFRDLSFSLALSWCGVSTVLNPVPLANLNRFQPIATDSKKQILVCSHSWLLHSYMPFDI